jgi:hypothetical protein
MSLDGSSRHLQLFCDFGVIAALQKQFYDFLFARPQANGLLTHHSLPISRINLHTWRLLITKEHLACHFETKIAVTVEHPFPQASPEVNLRRNGMR